MKQTFVVSAVLLLFANCSHVAYIPFPRSTCIRPGLDLEGGLGAGAGSPDSSGPQLSAKFLAASARLGWNPSDRLGLDANIHCCLGGRPINVPPFGASLAAGLRAGEANTMLFGETNLGCWRAGVIQGIPFTGLEVVTLGLTAGAWPEAKVPPAGIFNWPEVTWWPLVLGSLGCHVRSSRLRITPSLGGGYYWGAHGKPGRWLLAFTVSGARLEDDLDGAEMSW